MTEKQPKITPELVRSEESAHEMIASPSDIPSLPEDMQVEVLAKCMFLADGYNPDSLDKPCKTFTPSGYPLSHWSDFIHGARSLLKAMNLSVWHDMESSPKDGSKIWIRFSNSSPKIGYWSKGSGIVKWGENGQMVMPEGEWRENSSNGFGLLHAVGWMPLPEKPTDKERG